MKKLSEMSLEELWKLFPIVLTEHKESWKDWYIQENALLTNLLQSYSVKIHHIGSTAIEGIRAKPIVDILMETDTLQDLKAIAKRLRENGYIQMSEEENRISLNKGYTPYGFTERVFHVHLRLNGDNDEIYFRDYLLKNPAIAKEYEKLKLSLWKEYEHNRDGYTAAKTDFIRTYTQAAKEKKN